MWRLRQLIQWRAEYETEKHPYSEILATLSGIYVGYKTGFAYTREKQQKRSIISIIFIKLIFYGVLAGIIYKILGVGIGLYTVGISFLITTLYRAYSYYK